MYERSIDRWRADETISADDFLSLMKSRPRIASNAFSGNPPLAWHQVRYRARRRRGLALNRGADGGDGDDRADPRHRRARRRTTAPCVLRDLRGDGLCRCGSKSVFRKRSGPRGRAVRRGARSGSSTSSGQLGVSLEECRCCSAVILLPVVLLALMPLILIQRYRASAPRDGWRAPGWRS